MNIKYLGASEFTGGVRIAQIHYNADDEEDAVNRLMLLLQREYLHLHSLKFTREDEVVHIVVADREQYEEIKEMYKAFKAFNFLRYLREHNPKLLDAADVWELGILTSYGLYVFCKNDLDMYAVLVDENYNEDEIEKFMYKVSGGPDAYQAALDQLASVVW